MSLIEICKKKIFYYNNHKWTVMTISSKSKSLLHEKNYEK